MKKYDESERSKIVELSYNVLKSLHEAREYFENAEIMNNYEVMDEGEFMSDFLSFRFTENAANNINQVKDNLKLLKEEFLEIKDTCDVEFDVDEYISFVDRINKEYVAELLKNEKYHDGLKMSDEIAGNMYVILDKFKFRY